MTLPNKSDISTYGGILGDKYPITDPSTEISAVSLNKLRSDCAQMTRVINVAELQFTGSAGVPTLTSSSVWAVGFDSVWGNQVSFRPSFTHPGSGHYLLTFPSTITDPLGNAVLVSLRAGRGAIASSSVPGFVNVVISSATTADVYTFTSAGSANDLVGSVILVEVW
jgi:hypothetical protein